MTTKVKCIIQREYSFIVEVHSRTSSVQHKYKNGTISYSVLIANHRAFEVEQLS